METTKMKTMTKVNPEELAHFGVRGMKWGVRKEDSSGSGEAKKSRLQRSFEQKYDKSGKVAKLINKAKASTPEKKVIAERKSKAKNRRVISDEDLKKTVDRIQMEKKIKSLTDEDIAPGKTASLSFLAKVGSSAAMSAAGVAGATLMKMYLSSKGIG